MSIPTREKALVAASLERYCDLKVPAGLRERVQLDFRFEGNGITLFERRARHQLPGQWRELPLASFRYVAGTGHWFLFWHDPEGSWHRADETPGTADFEALLAEVDRDPLGRFWG
ncbi:MAG: DUF3024 domain-containing protein [Chloroflexi bacterium]|nr:DUF3024 domain-containing protein [Chloroflexota bacterium]